MYDPHRTISPHCLLRSLTGASANIELCVYFVSFPLLRKNGANIERNFKKSILSHTFLFLKECFVLVCLEDLFFHFPLVACMFSVTCAM